MCALLEIPSEAAQGAQNEMQSEKCTLEKRKGKKQLSFPPYHVTLPLTN